MKNPIQKAVEAVTHVLSLRPSKSRHTDDGFELLDPTPIAPPIGYVQRPSLVEQIRAMVVSEKLRQEAEAAGYESFEEADDFAVDDDFDQTSPYEVDFEPPAVSEIRERMASPDGDPQPEPVVPEKKANKKGRNKPVPAQSDAVEDDE